jgi:hypothetical protein
MKAIVAALALAAMAHCATAAAPTAPDVKKADGTVPVNPQLVGFDGELFSVAHQDPFDDLFWNRCDWGHDEDFNAAKLEEWRWQMPQNQELPP